MSVSNLAAFTLIKPTPCFFWFSKIFFSEPEALFSMIKENGGSLDFFKKLNLAKEMTRERFPDLINIKYEDAIDFLFWFIYAMENEVRDTILYVEDELGKERVKTEKMIDDMTFGMKVDFIENNYVSNKNNDKLYYFYIIGPDLNYPSDPKFYLEVFEQILLSFTLIK